MAPDIHKTWKWKDADTATTLKRYKLDSLFEKYGIGAHAEDLFGEVPATYVHAGDITVKKPLLLDAKGHGIFIIDGSLTIDGAFTYYTADAYTILVITGDFHAAHYYQAWDTQLVVLGETTIDGLLYINVSDAGFAVFRGPVTSRDRLIHQDVLSDVPMFAKKPKGKERDGLGEEDASTDPRDLHPKLVRNVDLFPPPPKGTKKPPNDAALKKMTVEEILAVPGFVEISIDNAIINPNWFRTGKPGEPLKKLMLDKTYIAEFPANLAALEGLTLIDQDDGARLATLLRSLPVLRALKSLRLYGTAVAKIPAEIGVLENLEELELIRNQKLSTLPIELAKLGRLRRLVVTRNAIKKLPAGFDLDHIPEVSFEEKALTLEREPK